MKDIDVSQGTYHIFLSRQKAYRYVASGRIYMPRKVHINLHFPTARGRFNMYKVHVWIRTIRSSLYATKKFIHSSGDYIGS